MPVCVRRYSTVGEHSSDKAYNYFVGVCVDALDDQPGCAVVQMSNDSTHCIGKTSQTQIARSESLVLLCACVSSVTLRGAL